MTNHEKLVKHLENSVKNAEKNGENMDDVSWGKQMVEFAFKNGYTDITPTPKNIAQ